MVTLGAWTVPLKCDNPMLAEWLTHLKVACTILGIPCDTEIEPALGICPQNWTALGILVTVCGLAFFLVTMLCLLVKQSVRWLKSRESGTMAALAGQAARQLHKSNPSLFPSVQHSWYKLPEDQLRVPSLCSECFETLQPDMDGKRVQCCEVCGVLCHESCCKKSSQDCRPVADLSQQMHLWKPAGCILYASEETLQMDSERFCLYCSGPCEADIFAQEPIWCCACCQAVAHVRCFRDFHALYAPENPSPAKGPSLSRKEKILVDSQEKKRDEIQEGKEGEEIKKSPPLLKLPNFDLGDGDLAATPKRKKKGKKKKKRNGQKENGFVGPEALIQPAAKSLPQGKNGMSHRRVRSEGSGFGSLLDLFGAAMTLGSSEDDFGGENDGKIRTAPGPCDLENLDTCKFGSHRPVIVPPTSVKMLPPHTWSEKAKDFLGRRGSISEKSNRLSSEVKVGAQKVANWWGESHRPWSKYKIENLPPGCKPLLVFLNIKSGPQSGTILRRKLLRLLNPIQVVELPKENPGEALELFADVPNLQIVVMGGDGTAGWILGCIDQIQEAKSKDESNWSPPPVAVIPMGTGNDLARCLGWGGGLQAIMHKGMNSLLRDIEHSSIVTLLDRWTVKIEPSNPPNSSSKGKLNIMSSLTHQHPSQVVKKPMNNYMGLGVDARASLDFHALRDSYPSWFRSQMGNKIWYTTVGAKDMIQKSSRGLSKNLQVECDGKVLALPEDIEGLLILNINSYMGGVDLWSSSSSWQNGYGKQSICDGILELVAVYGSWHLGQLQVGLSGAIRLTQCSSVKITARKEIPIQVDGEPWMQPPAVLEVNLKSKALMLRKADSEPLSRMSRAVADVLDESVATNLITNIQRRELLEKIASKLHPVQ